jgi:benzoyl-CoA reductase subunit A
VTQDVFQCYVGIDLGSTTTKSVVIGDRGEILGRGITNSRSNYDLACAIARSEAFVDAQMNRFRRALAEHPLLAEHAPLGASLERSFRHRQHVRQLGALRVACLEIAAGAGDLEGALISILAEMDAEAERRFRGIAGAERRSEFFRDVAGAQFQRLAEARADARRLPFEVIVGVFDKAILRVENEGDDLTFEGNARAALERALGLYRSAGPEVRAAAEELPFPKAMIRSEILCHGLGAHAMFPRTRTVLDIGGQDTKAIQVDAGGIVTSFQMNDRCAAGCGRYLGYIADEMSLGVHELGPLAEQSTKHVKISSTCTVFAGAELRDRLAIGEKREDILAGLHRAIILRAMSILARSGGVHEELTFTGGVANNPSAVRALRDLVEENYGDRTLNISPGSIYTGALGAALFALREAQRAGERPALEEVRA